MATLTDLWGDEAADIMDDAIAEIAGVFERTLERRPGPDELRSGLVFSLAAFAEEPREDKGHD